MTPSALEQRIDSLDPLGRCRRCKPRNDRRRSASEGTRQRYCAPSFPCRETEFVLAQSFPRFLTSRWRLPPSVEQPTRQRCEGGRHGEDISDWMQSHGGIKATPAAANDIWPRPNARLHQPIGNLLRASSRDVIHPICIRSYSAKQMCAIYDCRLWCARGSLVLLESAR